MPDDPQVPPCRKSTSCSVVYLGGKPHFIIYGGEVANRHMRNDTWIFQVPTRPFSDTSLIFLPDSDPSKPLKPAKHSNAWASLSIPAPPKRMKASLTAVSHDKYAALLFGGSDWSYGDKYYQDVWALAKKPKLRWVQLVGPSKPVSAGHYRKRHGYPCPRRAHTAVTMGPDRVVVFGGRPPNGRVLRDAWMYDLRQNRFTYLGDIPGQHLGRKGHSAVSYSDKSGHHMVIFGGRRNSRHYYDDVWQLSWDSKEKWSWKLLSNGTAQGVAAPQRRNHHVAVYYKHKMFIHGGRSAHAFASMRSDAWVFDLSTKAWMELPRGAKQTYPEGRSSHCAAAIHDQVIIYGGEGNINPYRNDLWMYSFPMNAWLQVEQNRCAARLIDWGVVWLGVTILFAGFAAAVYHCCRLGRRPGYMML